MKRLATQAGTWMILISLLIASGGMWGSPKPVSAASLGSTLYVFDYDRYIDQTKRADWYDMGVFLSTLQGVVNQDGPQLYIRGFNFTAALEQVSDSEAAGVNSYWLDTFRQPGQWLSEANVVQLDTIEDLVDVFGDRIEGLIVWDPKVEATVNIATTMAGVERAPIVMSGGALYDRLTSAPNNLSVKTGCTASPLTGPCDLTGKFNGANAKTDAYNWAVTHYLDTGKSNPGLLSYINDGLIRQPSSGGATSYIVSRDYLVKNKGFAFDLSPWDDERPNDAPEQTLGADRAALENILQSAYDLWGYQWPIEVIGFFPWWSKYSIYFGSAHGAEAGEWATVQLFSEYNATISSVMDTLGYANASFHSWAPIGKKLDDAPKPPARTTLGNNTYVLFYMGDHDGGTLHQTFPYFWNDKRRGSVPLTWGVSPTFVRDYPDIAQYVYDTATPNDFFVAGSSGAGYANPDFFGDSDLWREWNEFIYKKTDFTMSGFVLNGSAGELSASLENEYSSFSREGLIGSYAQISDPTPDVRSGDVAIAEMNSFPSSRTNAAVAAADIEAAANNAFGNIGTAPNFLVVRVSFAYPSFIESVYNRMKADAPASHYQAVDPHTFFSLVRQNDGKTSNDAIAVSSDLPDVMVTGQSYEVGLKVMNTGNATWSPGTLDRLADTTNNAFVWSDLNGGFSSGVGNQRVFLSSGETVLPQEYKEYRFTVTAPNTAGVYRFESQMIRDGVARIGLPYGRDIRVVSGTGNQAIVTAVSAPSIMEEGSTSTVSVTLKNVGSTTWTRASLYRLGSVQTEPLDTTHKKMTDNNVDWSGFADGGEGGAHQRVYLAAGDSIAPGQSKTFSFTIQAPSKRGQYGFSGQLVQDGVDWFGSAFEREITVVPPARIGLDSAPIGHTVPSYVKPGEHYRVTVSLKNVGTETWTAAGNYRLAAASANQLLFSNFKDGGYSTTATDQQIYLSSREPVGPESSQSFTFDMTAPSSPGSYTFAVKMVHGASSGPVLSIPVTVASALDASFVNDTIPLTMAAGSIHQVTMEVLNKGYDGWSEIGMYRLGTTINNQIPIVKYGMGGGSGTTPDNQRLFLPSGWEVGQGRTNMFALYGFSIQAPSTPGTYTFEVKMVKDGTAWFGDTKTLTIQVVGSYLKRVNVGGSAYTDSQGRVWEADKAYASGWGYTGSSTAGSSATAVTTTDYDSALYQSFRSGAPFGYKFDVPNGRYKVTLLFAELEKTASGQRQFALRAEGEDVLSGFDIYKSYLGRYKAAPIQGPYTAIVDIADGQLNLDFAGQIGNAQVNGLIIERIQ